MNKSTNPPRVFVSSTLEDLKAYRDKARDAILRLGWLPDLCDYWAAGGNPPLQTCLERIDAADVLIVIVAHRHGWTPTEMPADGVKSITRLECERAKERGVTVIPFMADDPHWPAQHYEFFQLQQCSDPGKLAEMSVAVQRNFAALADFKSWLNSATTRNVHGFSTLDELGLQVYQALTEWGKERGAAAGGPSQGLIRQGYLDWLRRECQSVELLGLDGNEDPNVRLDRVYVPAVTQPKADGKEPDAERRGDEKKPALLLQRLGEESLYVPGAPGSGKSTFCRWLALVVANGAVPAHPVEVDEAYDEVFPDGLQDRFPLLCRLRDWSGHTDCLHGRGKWTRKQLEDSLCEWIEATQPGGLTADVFRDELNAGTCLLILDGVDEVPEEIGRDLPRRNLLTGLAQAMPEWLRAGNRALLTSRPYGLEDGDRRRIGLTAAELLEMPPPLQTTFIHRWYAVTDPLRKTEKAEGLIAHLDSRPEMNDLRGNPILLTALCVKYGEGQKLPEDVFKLYQAVTTQVLYKRYPSERQHDALKMRLAAIALAMHRGPADRPRKTPEAEVDVDEIDRILCHFAQTDWAYEQGALSAAETRENLLSNSGLLLPRAGGRAAFYHLSFQEYLAAVRLWNIREKPEAILESHASVRAWHRTLVFLFCAYADRNRQEAMEAFAPLEAKLAPGVLERDSVPALLLCDCLEVAHARGWPVKERYCDALRRACEHALTHLDPPQRAYLWRTLGQLGWDDRSGVGAKDGLPDIAWSDVVPAGGFKYGAKALPARIDHPFRIALHPVTNAQYQCFIDDHGYENEVWWDGLAGWPERRDPRWNIPNHPRETVSWYEATAFCRWLTARLRAAGGLSDRLVVRLPTEQEWERAARGTDGREYPWEEGVEKGWNQRNANAQNDWGDNGEFYIGQTTAVGIYPTGRSPAGVFDMAGNVWEWCATQHESPNNNAPGGSAPRVLRGGSWDDYRVSCRCAYRGGNDPGYRYLYCGFRLVLAPPMF